MVNFEKVIAVLFFVMMLIGCTTRQRVCYDKEKAKVVWCGEYKRLFFLPDK